MKKAELFIRLQIELKEYVKPLGEAIDIMIDSEVSQYPIFVIHQQEVEIGVPIINHEEVNGNWSVNASSMEEFIVKQIIAKDKIKAFQESYKDPTDFICIFSLSELGAQFIFIKRK